MAYERPPEPGVYYIKSVAAPKCVLEVPDFNQERVLCSPQVEKPMVHIKSTGRGYKIKNVKYGVYLVPHSTQPKNGTVIGASPNQPPKTWSIMRTHDGFTIEYGEDGVEIDLPYGLDKLSNTMHLWFILPNSSSHRWKFEKLSDEVGGEAAETFEDRIAALSDQLQKAGVEIAAKDQLLAQKEQELQSALKSRREVPVKAIEAQLAELCQKIEGLEFLVKSYGDHSERPNNTS